MNIEKLDSSRIIISLCNNELESYCVSFESLDPNEAHSKKLLSMLMKSAASQTGVSFRNKHIVIEALKFENGCMLLFTITSRKRVYRIKYYNDAYIFSFTGAEELLCCAEALYRMGRMRFSSSVYLFGGKYWLVLNCKALPGQKFLCTIREFCKDERRGALAGAVLAEHGKLIAKKNAIEVLGRAL